MNLPSKPSTTGGLSDVLHLDRIFLWVRAGFVGGTAALALCKIYPSTVVPRELSHLFKRRVVSDMDTIHALIANGQAVHGVVLLIWIGALALFAGLGALHPKRWVFLVGAGIHTFCWLYFGTAPSNGLESASDTPMLSHLCLIASWAIVGGFLAKPKP